VAIIVLVAVNYRKKNRTSSAGGEHWVEKRNKAGTPQKIVLPPDGFKCFWRKIVTLV